MGLLRDYEPSDLLRMELFEALETTRDGPAPAPRRGRRPRPRRVRGGNTAGKFWRRGQHR